MGLLKSLFGGGPAGARHEEDHVWVSNEARAYGVLTEAERLRGQGQSVIVVVRSAAEVDEIAVALADLAPGRVTDAFSRFVLADALSSPGRVVVASANALPADVKPAEAPVAILVWGRAATRAPDDAIVSYADRLGARAAITFCLSLEDPLLREHGASLQGILQALKMPDDEAISASMVSRAVENLQKKNA